MTAAQRPFFALSPAEAQEAVAQRGGRAFHARIVRREVVERGILDYDAMTSLPAPLRARLAAELPLVSAREVARRTAPDATTKLLLAFPDGKTVEVVHIPSRRAERGATLCVSTQVGCPVRCPFCASGKDGLVRNLAGHEIVEQYLLGRALGPLSRSVVMGIGEPLLNFPALMEALVFAHDDLGLGSRKTTVSTVGFPDRLDRVSEGLAADKKSPPFQLAISLHSPDDDQRGVLIPAMRGVPVTEVVAAGDRWFARTSREVTYEYVLLAGTNDSRGHAQRLGRLLARRRATVNLIPFNPVDDSPYGRPEARDVERFRATLEENGVVATVRWSRGMESDAACGQLRVRQGAEA